MTYRFVDFTPRDIAILRDATSVNAPIPPVAAKLKNITAKPMYGSLWRWLFRRPRYRVMTAEVEVDPAAVKGVMQCSQCSHGFMVEKHVQS